MRLIVGIEEERLRNYRPSEDTDRYVADEA